MGYSDHFPCSFSAPNDKMKEVIKKTIQEAKDLISKVLGLSVKKIVILCVSAYAGTCVCVISNNNAVTKFIHKTMLLVKHCNNQKQLIDHCTLTKL